MISLELLLISIVALLGQNLFSTPSRNFTSETTNPSIIETVNKEESSVVTVRGYKRLPTDSLLGITSMVQATSGTGFIIDENGTVLTNRHVVANNDTKYTVITNNGLKYNVEDIKRDPNNDIAALKINPKQHEDYQLNAVTLGDSNNIKLEEPIVALGEDLGNIQPTLLTGVVSGVGDTIIASDSQNKRYERLHNLIQTNLKLVPGNSGSPLFDETGKVIGINTATASGVENVSYAIPINAAKKFLDSIKQ